MLPWSSARRSALADSMRGTEPVPPREPAPAPVSLARLAERVPPVREDATVPDGYDAARLQQFREEYERQTDALLLRDRQIEYNIRMVLGQQRNVWNPALGQFFDVSAWLPDHERAWRQLVVVNKELKWFMLTHARLTENPPVLTMLPGPDRIDRELAEVADALFKHNWRDAGMESVHDELMMWVVLAGEGYLLSRLDPTKGPWRPWVGPADVPVVGPDGVPLLGDDGQPVTARLEDVPLRADGSPNAEVRDGQLVPLGPPHMERTGGIAVDVYSPLQIRGAWGPEPWHEKRWHAVKRFLTPEQVWEAYGVDVEPDLSRSDSATVNIIERLLYGSGYYGTQVGRGQQAPLPSTVRGDWCTVYERWEAPWPYRAELEGTVYEVMLERPGHPGGRHTVFTPSRVLLDGPRTVAWPFTSPVRQFTFVRLPGRVGGMTPLESLHGPQRTYNQSRQQQVEHAALLANPQLVLDKNAGIQPSQITNAPGTIYVATRTAHVPVGEYLQAPPLSPDSYRVAAQAAEDFRDLSGEEGASGGAPTENASGELVKELRFNSDRPLGATARRAVAEYARMGRDWLALYRLLYDEDTVLAINGEDHVAQTLTVYPRLFEDGFINIVPDVESMLPEGRGERQKRAYLLWKEGAFGPPGSPQANDIFLELSRFPHYAKLARPGGVDRDMAEQENGAMLSGDFEQPVYEWYDHFVHLQVHERYMKSPAYRKQDPVVQQAFAFHRLQHLLAVHRLMAQSAQSAPPRPVGGPSDRGGAGSDDNDMLPKQMANDMLPEQMAEERSRKPVPPREHAPESVAPAMQREGGAPASVGQQGRLPTALSRPEG